MKLLAHTYVSPKGSFLNGAVVFDTRLEENPLKAAYHQLQVDYPKFYKMDALSKMAFIGSELLKSYFPTDVDLENDLCMIFANTSASQLTDQLFVDSYTAQKSPSPSLFVYTLPNIVTGELSIRHKWTGENAFYIEEQFDEKNYLTWAQLAFARGNTCCLCGWVEAKPNGEQECFLFLLSNSPQNNQITENELSTLIKQYRNE